jgi:two-component system chemotaxis sensor kinase CheA
MVGELVITQSMLSQTGSQIAGGNHTIQEKLQEGISQLERNTRELQESVLQIRMLPISFSFSRFPRLVRDLSGKMGKKIELKMVGENTEVDKTVLEKIGDPLVHLVRNSLDHGIETPEIRTAAGKPEVGTLELQAYHEGGDIIIKVIDDGAGLNRERIKIKAVEKGLVNEGEEISDDKIYNMIFQAGFSTAEQVTDVSGRGVGMDVVRRNIRDLGGNVSITSNDGAGSTVTIRLPLTLAILDGQLASIGDETYIISLVSIVESLQMQSEKISSITGQSEFYSLRDEYIPIIRVNQLFGMSKGHAELNNGLLIVVEADGQQVGLFVDELLGQQQVVIKSLETNFRQIQGISGATILGDGTVALIIDVPGLINRHFEDCNRRNVILTAVA